MTNKHLDLLKPLLDLGMSRGYLFDSDLEAQLPNWSSSEQLRLSIVTQLSVHGIAIFPDGLPPATMGLLEEVSSAEQISPATLGTASNFDSSVSCRLSFVCDKSWDELQRTSDSSVCYCGDCKKTVHLCWSKEEAIEAIAKRQCVALLFSHVLVQPE